MRFYKQFGLSAKEIGSVRAKFVNRVEKRIGKFLEYRFFYAPQATEKDRRHGLSKIKGPTEAERVKHRFFMFSADVTGKLYTKLVGYVAPIPKGSGKFMEEYTYTAPLPFSIDAGVCFLERCALVYGQGILTHRGPPETRIIPPGTLYRKGEARWHHFDAKFWTVPLGHSGITEEMLFQEKDAPAFQLTYELQQSRINLLRRFSLPSANVGRSFQSGRGIQESGCCAILNTDRQLHRQLMRIRALSDGKVGRMNLWIRMLIVPLRGMSFVQIGDFELKPEKAIETFDMLSETLKAIQGHITAPRPSVGRTKPSPTLSTPASSELVTPAPSKQEPLPSSEQDARVKQIIEHVVISELTDFYVMVKVEAQKVHRVIKAVEALEGVKWADKTIEPDELKVFIKASSPEELQKLLEAIRAIDGMDLTTPFPIELVEM